MNKKDQSKIIIKATVLSLIVGLASGIIGASLTENYLSSYVESLQVEVFSPTQSEQKPRPLPGTYEESLETVREQVLPAVVTIYTGNSLSSNAYYTKDDILGHGIIFTSDGWIMTADSLFDFTSTSNVVIKIGNNLFEISEFFEDPEADVFYCKVDANNLPVVAYAASDEVSVGELMFVAKGDAGLFVSSVVETDYVLNTASVSSSEEFVNYIMLQDLSTESLGSPVINSVGELVGLVVDQVDSQSVVRPLHQITPASESLLRTGKVERTILGVNYIDLEDAIGIDEELSLGYERGALLAADRYYGRQAVAPNSPADLAGLQKNDIILSVGPDLIGGRHTLSELVSQYSPLDAVELGVRRGEEDLSIWVTFGPVEVGNE